METAHQIVPLHEPHTAPPTNVALTASIRHLPPLAPTWLTSWGPWQTARIEVPFATIQAAINELEYWIQPCGDEAVLKAVAVVMLGTKFHPTWSAPADASDAQQLTARITRDLYIRALDHLPADLLRAACSHILANLRFVHPMPGDFMGVVADELRARYHHHRQLHLMLNAVKRQKPVRQWAPPTDEERAQVSETCARIRRVLAGGFL